MIDDRQTAILIWQRNLFTCPWLMKELGICKLSVKSLACLNTSDHFYADRVCEIYFRCANDKSK